MKGLWCILCVMYVCGAFGALPDVPLCDAGYPVMTVTETTETDSDTGEEITTKTVEYSCQSYTQGVCPDSFVARDLHGVFMTDMVGKCSDDMRKIRSGGLFIEQQLPVTLCDNGYFNGDSCVPYAPDTENCPSGYNKMFVNSSVQRVLDTCPDGTHLISDNQISVWSYPYDSVPDTMVAVRLCDSGYDMNYMGDCTALCAVSNTGVNMQYLRTSTGLVFPVYVKKLTTPSLNVKAGSRQCYINLVPGSGSGAINVQYQDVLYKTVN